MTLPRFLYCESKEPPLKCILQTVHPFIIGYIIEYTSDDTLLDFITKTKPFTYRLYPSRNLCIYFAGTFTGKFTATTNVIEIINIHLTEMAGFYLGFTHSEDG